MTTQQASRNSTDIDGIIPQDVFRSLGAIAEATGRAIANGASLPRDISPTHAERLRAWAIKDYGIIKPTQYVNPGNRDPYQRPRDLPAEMARDLREVGYAKR